MPYKTTKKEIEQELCNLKNANACLKSLLEGDLDEPLTVYDKLCLFVDTIEISKSLKRMANNIFDSIKEDVQNEIIFKDV